jgi:hypothetical protein
MIGCAYLTIAKQFVNLEFGSPIRQRVMSGRSDSLAGGAALPALQSNRQWLFDQLLASADPNALSWGSNLNAAK